MSAIYFAIPTDAGQAKIANAIALGIPLKITHMAVGDGNGQPVTPNAAQTALVREKRRAPLNTLFQDPLNQAQLVAEQIIPEDVGDWWIREVGIFSEDGTLIAVANCPDTYKPLLSSGAGRTQVIRLVLVVSDTSAVELKIDPSVVLATRKYVDDVMAAHKQSREHPAGTKSANGMLRLATLAEALAGVLDTVAITPKDALEVAFSAYPVGAPIPWPTAVPPTGFLAMKGQSFSATTYPKLALAYPGLVLPDLRGEFIRGLDGGRGIDAGRAALSLQLHALQNIYGGFAYRPYTATTYGAIVSPTGGFATLRNAGEISLPMAFGTQQIAADLLSFDASRVANTANETRPRNIAFNYIVRAA